MKPTSTFILPQPIALALGAMAIMGIVILEFNAYTQAHLTLQLNEPDVTLKLDGTTSSISQTYTTTLKPGTHTLLLQKTGYADYSATLTLPTHGQISQTINLKPLELNQQFAAAAQAAAIQSLGTADDPGLTVLSAQTFENDTWIAAQVVSTKVNTDPGMVVFQRVNGSLKLVLGPGTFFDRQDTTEVPSSVLTYLLQRGCIIGD